MSDRIALLLEDQAMIALDLQDQLLEQGYGVVHLRSSSEAQNWLASGNVPDLAIVDVELTDGSSHAVMSELSTLGVAVVVHSGSDQTLANSAFSNAVWLEKPSRSARLLAAIRLAQQRRAAGGHP